MNNDKGRSQKRKQPCQRILVKRKIKSTLCRFRWNTLRAFWVKKTRTNNNRRRGKKQEAIKMIELDR